MSILHEIQKELEQANLNEAGGIWKKLAQERFLGACRDAVQNGVDIDVLNWWQDNLTETLTLRPVDQRLRPHYTAMARAMLGCTQILVENDARDSSWLHGDLASNKLATIAKETSLDQAPYGLPFFKALCRSLQSAQDETGQDDTTVAFQSRFPLVHLDAVGNPTGGIGARFLISRTGYKEDATGGLSLFISPSQAFLTLDEEFRASFRLATEAVNTLEAVQATNGGKPLGGELCVRIQLVENAGFVPVSPAYHLRGPSAGGALALGLGSCLTGIRLEPHVYSSFALTGTIEPGAVGGLRFKATEIFHLDQKALDPVLSLPGQVRLLVAQEQYNVLAQIVDSRLLLDTASLNDAFEKATGRLRALLAYLDLLEQVANAIPTYQRGWSARPLSDVYVRVRVYPDFRKQFDPDDAARNERILLEDPETRYERLYNHPVWREGEDEKARRKREEEKPKELAWEEARSNLQKGVIIGDPGIGKSWLLRREAVRMAAELRERIRAMYEGGLDWYEITTLEPILRQAPVPLWMRLDTLARRLKPAKPDAGLMEAVHQALRDTLPEFQEYEPFWAVLTERHLQAGSSVLLLDALDEVSADKAGPADPSQRDTLVNALRDWTGTYGQARVLLTSRAASYSFLEPPLTLSDPSKQQVELLPFNDPQIKAFVANWFDDGHSNGMLAMLKQSPQLQGMSRIPLLLGFLCLLYEEDGGVDFKTLRRTDIYREVLMRILHRIHKDQRGAVTREDIEQLLCKLEHLAFHLFAAGLELFTGEDLRLHLGTLDQEATDGLQHAPQLLKQLLERLEAAKTRGSMVDPDSLLSLLGEERNGKAWTTYLKEFLGLIIPLGSSADPSYMFLHLTFQEYLAAGYLARRINDRMRSGWVSEVTVRDGGRLKTVQVEQFLDHKAWDPRYEQVVLLFTGQLAWEEDQARLLELLIYEGKKWKGKEDDRFLHRHALAAFCLLEIKALLQAERVRHG